MDPVATAARPGFQPHGDATDRGSERRVPGARLVRWAHRGSCGRSEREAISTFASLRARLDLDSGYLSRLLRRLEGDGLIVVEQSPDDGRARIARLTGAGRDRDGSFSTVAAMSWRGRCSNRSTTSSAHVSWRRWASSSGSSRPASWRSGSRSPRAPQFGIASSRTSPSSTRASRPGSTPAAASRPRPDELSRARRAGPARAPAGRADRLRRAQAPPH